MANGVSAEASAIEAEYAAHIQTLFSVLTTNLGDQPITHLTDQECLRRFKAGLDVAKRAKQMALGAI